MISVRQRKREEFTRMWLNGDTIAQIAKACGITEDTVRHWRRSFGLPPRDIGLSVQRRAALADRDAEMYRLHKEGVTIEGLRRAYGLNSDSVHNALERAAQAAKAKPVMRKCLRCGEMRESTGPGDRLHDDCRRSVSEIGFSCSYGVAL